VTAPQAELLLVRHARTAWHWPNRYTGRSDIELDEVGRLQAEALGEWSRTASLAALYSSPMARTMATAAPVAEATGLPVVRRESLREIDFGIAEGRTIDEIQRDDALAVRAFQADPITGHWPAGDDPGARTDEAVTALAEIASAHGGQRVLVMAHSTLVRLMLCRLLAIPLSRYRISVGRPEPTAVSTLRWDGRGPATLESFNVPVAAAHRP
jgi:probable phosphoglycerate mutase